MKHLQIVVQNSDLEKLMTLFAEIKVNNLILSKVELQKNPMLPLVGKQISMKQISVILENEKVKIFSRKIKNLKKSLNGTLKISVSNVSEIT